jgi:hypothetical protein
MITAMRYSSPLLSGLALCLVASVSLAAARPAPISPVAGEIRERVLVQLPKGQQVLPLGSQLLRSPEQLRAFYRVAVSTMAERANLRAGRAAAGHGEHGGCRERIPATISPGVSRVARDPQARSDTARRGSNWICCSPTPS